MTDKALDNTLHRQVFYVSDGTGITIEALGHSVLTQFENVHFSTRTLPYIDTPEKLDETIALINECANELSVRPLVFASLVNASMRDKIRACRGRVFDIFESFLIPIEKELGIASSHMMGKSHSIIDSASYNLRIDAVNYTLDHDDGVQVQHYAEADLILAGVSRSGKTPTSLYLALQFGIKAANFPFVEEIDDPMQLPKALVPFRHKIFGLTIDAERLCQIRQERRPDSQYASMLQCRNEIASVESMFQKERIPFLNTTRFSIEEISTRIMAASNIERRIL